MKPPWVEHPDIPIGSIGWRMGYGEEYIETFAIWLAGLRETEREQLVADCPEPPGWEGFYESWERWGRGEHVKLRRNAAPRCSAAPVVAKTPLP